jgi:uncharacterized membrane protein YidH (DUF202 family)
VSPPRRRITDDRTVLAWQRTALSLLGGSVLVARLTYPRIGVLALAAVVLLLPLGAAILAIGRGGQGPGAPARAGRIGALLAGVVAVTAVTQLVALAVGP